MTLVKPDHLRTNFRKETFATAKQTWRTSNQLARVSTLNFIILKLHLNCFCQSPLLGQFHKSQVNHRETHGTLKSLTRCVLRLETTLRHSTTNSERPMTPESSLGPFVSYKLACQMRISLMAEKTDPKLLWGESLLTIIRRWLEINSKRDTPCGSNR